MAVLKCKMCGGSLDVTEGMTVCECEYCGTVQTIPQIDDEKKITLFTRANRLRAACEFDKAAGVYENIVSNFPEEAEAYWGLVLCKFGIEYVDDPATGKKIPTCHRSSFESIMDDPDFEQTMENADPIARKVYREEAKTIDGIQKGILEISGKEEPYDIFICYKETDDNGERTVDSVMAQDIYDMLTENKYRVFFARISLEDKLGTAYEPYIFAALNSARIMLAVGTDYEYYNAVWVKNEWSRFLAMMSKDKKKVLIPCYKDIDAYDIPKEFKHLQAQDMGKVGAMQDLLRGIKKILPKETAPAVQPVTQVTQVVQSTPNVDPLLQRAFMFLEDGDWDNANSYCEKVLDIDPKNAEAYLGKLMAELQVRKREQLGDQEKHIDENVNYQKVMKFGNDTLKAEIESYLRKIIDREQFEANDKKYKAALHTLNSGKLNMAQLIEAKSTLEKLGEFKDSVQLLAECDKRIAEKIAEINERNENKYSQANELFEKKQYNEALDAFMKIVGYKDSLNKLSLCCDAIPKENAAIQNEIENRKKYIEQLRNEQKKDERTVRACKNNIWQLVAFETELKKLKEEQEQILNRNRSLENEFATLGIFAGAKKKQIRAEIDSNNIRLAELGKKIGEQEHYINTFDHSSNNQEVIDQAQKQIDSNRALIDQVQAGINELEARVGNEIKTETTEMGIKIGSVLIINKEEIEKISDENNTIKEFIKSDSISAIIIPYGVTSIGESAFVGCSSLTSVTIPDSVTSIGNSAFYGCKGLANDKGFVIIRNVLYSYHGNDSVVTIPDSVTSIGDDAFKWCSSLTSVTIPDSVTSIGKSGFFMCTSLTSVTIPDSVTSIGESAFVGCSSLTSVTIPDSVTSIGSRAFWFCKSLTSVTIPDSVTSIGWCAFRDTPFLNNDKREFVFYGKVLYKYQGNQSDVVIPDSVTSIGDGAFGECTSLTSVTIPDSVTSIGASAFYGCKKLTSITIPDSVTSIGDGAFKGCEGLSGDKGFVIIRNVLYSYHGNDSVVTIPDSVTSIGRYAFERCRNLTSVTIPDSVTSIGVWAFRDCKSLTSVTIPDSVTSIGDGAFKGCEGLSDDKGFVIIRNVLYSYHGNDSVVTIPDNVTSIGRYAFDGCTSLTSVTIPDSVTSIGYGAFDKCKKLTIKCKRGSYAETYAKDNKIPVSAI